MPPHLLLVGSWKASGKTPAQTLLLLAAFGGTLAMAGAALAAPGFEHAAAEEGLAFTRAGDRFNNDPSFLEVSGGGACWLDYDADGDQDLFLVNGWYNDTALAAARDPRSVLYRNDGPRAGPDFVDATAEAGLDVQGWTQGCAAADYDADGFEDLLVVGDGLQWLYRNRGDGTFADVSAASGISAAGKCGPVACWGSSAAWADYDRDGCLDVYVLNFVAFNRTLGGPRGPGLYDGQPNQLYRNQCDGTFADVTAQAHADGNPGPAHGKDWGVTWLDYDRDGWLDLYVASDGVPNILYRNNGDGTFTDTAVQAGVADQRNGMGTAAADCDNDGFEDLFMTHYKSPQEAGWWGWDGFYVNNGNGTFTDHSGEGDLAVTEPFVKWGVGWEDLDNDGDLDLHVATGHTENGAFDVEQPHLLWTGDGACHWTDARAAAGPALATTLNSRGSAYADYDLDGAIDAVVVNIMDQPVELLHNTGAPGHWLTLELRQPGGNARGIGAWVNVTAGAVTQHFRMMPSRGIHGSNPAQVHVGLGPATAANVTVVWPADQTEQRFPGLAADQLLRLHRSGRVQRDTLAPVSALAVSGTPGEPGWWRSPIVATAQAADRGVAFTSGVDHVYARLDDGPEVADPGPMALGEGAHVIRLRSVDAEGNAELARAVLTGVDTGPPVSAAALAGTLDGGAYRGPLGVTLACADAVSGPARLEWRVDAEPWQAYAGPFDLARPGPHALGWRCTDQAGNVEAAHALDFTQDLGHPATRAVLDGPRGLAGWWVGPVEVRLAAEAWPPALAGTWVAVDGGEPFAYTGPFTLAADGVHRVAFGSTDDAGREEPSGQVEVPLDATPPAVRFTDPAMHVDLPEALLVGPAHAVRAAAEDLSGVASLEVRRAGLDPLWTANRPLRFPGEGSFVAEARFADRAGNAGSLTGEVRVDFTPPAVAVLRPGQDTVDLGDAVVLPIPPNPSGSRAVLIGPVTLEASAEDAFAGMDAVIFRVDQQVRAVVREAPWTWTWDLPPGTPAVHHVAFFAQDRVGNVAGTAFFVVATGDPGAALPEAGPVGPGGGASDATGAGRAGGAAPLVLFAGVAVASWRARRPRP